MCKTVQVQSSMASAVCLRDEEDFISSLWTAASQGFMNVHCGFDLPINHRGFGAVGTGQRTPSRSGCCLLLLGGWSWKHQILGENQLGKNIVIFCISPAWSTAQLEATGEREGHVSPKQLPATAGSALPYIHFFC